MAPRHASLEIKPDIPYQRTFVIQKSTLHAPLMLPTIPYSSTAVITHVGHRHNTFFLRSGLTSSYRARRRQAVLFKSAEVLSAATVRQRPFIEGDSIASSPDDSEIPVLYTHTLWYAAFYCRIASFT